MDDDNKAEIVEVEEVKDSIPSMNVTVTETEAKPPLIEDNKLLEIYEEIMNDLRADRVEISQLVNEFSEMVINQGDPSSATKESLVNLIKAKSDIADKKAKIADLMTRVKMKERDTFPRYLAANQNNKITVNKNEVLSLEDKKKLIHNLSKGNEAEDE